MADDDQQVDLGAIDKEFGNPPETSVHWGDFVLKHLHHNLDITLFHVFIAVIFIFIGFYLGNKYSEYNELKEHFSQFQTNIFNAQEKVILPQIKKVQ